MEKQAKEKEEVEAWMKAKMAIARRKEEEEDKRALEEAIQQAMQRNFEKWGERRLRPWTDGELLRMLPPAEVRAKVTSSRREDGAVRVRDLSVLCCRGANWRTP